MSESEKSSIEENKERGRGLYGGQECGCSFKQGGQWWPCKKDDIQMSKCVRKEIWGGRSLNVEGNWKQRQQFL